MKVKVKSGFDERYETSALEDIVNRLNKEDAVTHVVFKANPEADEAVKLENVIGIVEAGSAEIDKGQIYYDVAFYKGLPKFDDIKTLIDHGSSFSIRLAPLGIVNPKSNTVKKVHDVRYAYISDEKESNLLGYF